MLSELDTPLAPRVFLSYASDDAIWVHQFKQWFVESLGTVVVVDFKDGSNLEFGPLAPWLDARVSEASAMVAFVSRNYTRKFWTHQEWLKGLTKTQRGQLIFIPVMMDADAKVWWAKLRRDGELSALPPDYQYADFTVAGQPVEIDPASPVVVQISKLAGAVRGMLEKSSTGSSEPEPGGAPTAASDSARISDVFLLGSPFGRLDAELQAQVDAAEEELRNHSLPSQRWGDGWRNNADRRVLPDLSKESPIFVQPVVAGEVEEPLTYANKAVERLTTAGVKGPRLALWLPHGQKDTAFEALASPDKADAFPALRIDTPQALAVWLCDLVRPLVRPDTVVLQIETVGYPEDTIPDEITTRLADDLRCRFSGIVNREIRPNPDLWPFWRDEINDQIKMLPGNRAIIAVHDLDIAPSRDLGTFRSALELKLSQAQDAVEEVNKEKTGTRVVDPFFTALLVKNANAFPFGSYPSNGRFKDWRLLRFEGTGVKPLPASLAVFRGQLHKWAAGRASVGAAP